MRILKILKAIFVVLSPVLLFALPLAGMVIGGALLTLPGIFIGSFIFDDIPGWYGVIFVAMPAGIGMYAGVSLVIKGFGSLDSFGKADRNIDKCAWDNYMNR